MTPQAPDKRSGAWIHGPDCRTTYADVTCQDIDADPDMVIPDIPDMEVPAYPYMASPRAERTEPRDESSDVSESAHTPSWASILFGDANVQRGIFPIDRPYSPSVPDAHDASDGWSMPDADPEYLEDVVCSPDPYSWSYPDSHPYSPSLDVRLMHALCHASWTPCV